MDHTLEHFDPASEGFALIAESLEAAGLSLEAGGSNVDYTNDESASV